MTCSKNPKWIVTFICGWLLAGAQAVAVEVAKPHPLFTDHLVLQRDRAVPVWGTAEDGQKVTVSIAGQTVSTTAENGRWQVQLEPLAAGGPHELVIEGPDRTVVQDVLVGEVWICSGQSNMEWPLRAAHESSDDIADSTNEHIRLFMAPNRAADEPQSTVDAEWTKCTPDTVANFSAVGYYFGRALKQHLDVPIGLISCDWGGTPAEAWTSREALAADEDLKHYVAQERDPNNKNRPYGLYNGMLRPLVPYGIRGAIWYQGESNAGQAYEYRTLFPAMITDWREQFGQGDFPFLFVQLAPFMKIVEEPGDSAWAELREAQLMTMQNVPNTAMAVITDVGEENDIHPRKKLPVGERLALAARALAYGEDIVYSGPILAEATPSDDGMYLKFKHTGEGLESRDGKLTGFAIAGADKKFHNAEAKIVGPDTVLVRSDQVDSPVAVRYGWASFPLGNLWNSAGLPASPFRTDEFPGVTQKKRQL